MHVGGKARFFASVSSLAELKMALIFAKEKRVPVFILGGGSNIIVSDSGFSGLVIKVNLRGVKVVRESSKYRDYEVFSGEIWDDFAKFSVNQKLYGVENLSHIPGTVGASVVQNIGAYGQEVSSSVVFVKVINRKTLKEKILSRKEIKFSYRKSCLNDPRKYKNKYVVTSIVFRLWKKGKLNFEYNDLKKYFENHPKIIPSLKTLRMAIISVRDNKFPFPGSPKNGSVGSFWNAKSVNSKTFDSIIHKLRKMGHNKKAQEMVDKKSVFRVKQGMKVTPGLFVEILGYRGKSRGGAKILESHAGVINNFTGRAKAKDIYNLSKEVSEKVYKEFGIRLRIEPELVGDFD